MPVVFDIIFQQILHVLMQPEQIIDDGDELLADGLLCGCFWHVFACLSHKYSTNPGFEPCHAADVQNGFPKPFSLLHRSGLGLLLLQLVEDRIVAFAAFTRQGTFSDDVQVGHTGHVYHACAGNECFAVALHGKDPLAE